MRPSAQRLVLLGVFAAALLAACGGRAPSPNTGAATEPIPSVLQDWADFPVHLSPRPIVLLGSPVLDPRGGFPDGESKLAYMNCAFDLATRLPSGPRTADGFSVISAEKAFGLLRSTCEAVSASRPVKVRLNVPSAAFASGTFRTDRGERTLPAWLFSLVGVQAPVAVLAVAPAALWAPDGLTAYGRYASYRYGARIANDDRTLTVRFVGAAAGTGPCTANYTLTLTESVTAVMVRVNEQFNAAGANVGCTQEGYPRTASAVLLAPLGNRVVVDSESGGPIAVTGAAQP